METPALLTAGAPVPVELRKTLVGSFYSAELDAVYLIREDGQRLIVEVGDQSVPVLLSGPDRLRLQRGGIVSVPSRDASGRVNSFTLDAGRVRGLPFTRRSSAIRRHIPGGGMNTASPVIG